MLRFEVVSDPFQQFRAVEHLRTFGETGAAIHARRRGCAALDWQHGDHVVEQRLLPVFVQQIVVVDVSENVADRDIVRARDALVAAGCFSVFG